MAHRYVKHPKYVGKSLTIHRGRRDRLVRDNEILTGREWEKFVAQGLLVPAPEEAAPKVEPKPQPKPQVQPPTPKLPPEPPKAPEPVMPPAEPEKVEKVDESKEEAKEPEEEAKEPEGSVSKSPASKVSGMGGKRKRSKKERREE